MSNILVQIENMSADDIVKGHRGLVTKIVELVAPGSQSPVLCELATRFIDARYDAKLRDQTLAQQGTDLDRLRLNLADAAKVIDGLKKSVIAAETQTKQLLNERDKLKSQTAIPIRLDDKQMKELVAQIRKEGGGK